MHTFAEADLLHSVLKVCETQPDLGGKVKLICILYLEAFDERQKQALFKLSWIRLLRGKPVSGQEKLNTKQNLEGK